MMLTTLRSRSASLRRQIAARALMLSRSPGCAQRSFATARSNTLTLVAVNDVYDLEHLPKLRTLVDAVKAERREGRVITTLAGDFLSPSVLSSLDRGRGMVQVLNAVGVDYACFGNHEADVGLKALRKRIGEFSATLINSNVPGAVVDAPATAVVSFPAVHKSNCRGASHGRHAIDTTQLDGVAVGVLPPLDSVNTAAISPRKVLLKNYRCT